MKDLLVSEIFPPRTGGSGRWFWELYRRLPRDPFTIAAGTHADAAVFDAQHDMPVERLPLTLRAWGLASLSALRGYARSVRAVQRLVKRDGITRLHCGRCLPEGWMAWLLRRVTGLPYLCYVHGEDIGTAATSRELRWMVRRVLNGADLLIANSHNTARLLKDEWQRPESQVRVLHPGVDADKFTPAPRDRAVRAALGWGDRPVLLTVGRLQRRKGQDMLIRALSAIRRAIPDVLYAVIGEGEERSALNEIVNELELAHHVQFQGELQDERLVECYQQCDLFVLPNRTLGGDIEGFGMVLVEAQACGKPVLAGDSGGTAETMHIPRTGRVVNCDAPDALAASVVEMLNDCSLRLRMGHAAREWAVEQFDWATLTERALELFDPTSLSPTRKRGRNSSLACASGS